MNDKYTITAVEHRIECFRVEVNGKYSLYMFPHYVLYEMNDWMETRMDKVLRKELKTFVMGEKKNIQEGKYPIDWNSIHIHIQQNEEKWKRYVENHNKKRAEMRQKKRDELKNHPYKRALKWRACGFCGTCKHCRNMPYTLDDYHNSRKGRIQ